MNSTRPASLLPSSYKAGVAVQEPPYPQLRDRLLAQGQMLKLPQASEIPAVRELFAEKASMAFIHMGDTPRSRDDEGHQSPHPAAACFFHT